MTTDKKKSAYNRMADKLDRIQAFEGKTTQTGPDTNEDLVIFRVLVGQARETIDKMEELLVKIHERPYWAAHNCLQGTWHPFQHSKGN